MRHNRRCILNDGYLFLSTVFPSFYLFHIYDLTLGVLPMNSIQYREASLLKVL